MGFIYNSMNRWTEAEEYMQRGLVIMKEHGAKQALKNDLVDFVKIYREHREFEKALLYLEE